jgi:hypothetical protein
MGSAAGQLAWVSITDRNLILRAPVCEDGAAGPLEVAAEKLRGGVIGRRWCCGSLANGIEASDDPLIDERDGAYAVSYSRRRLEGHRTHPGRLPNERGLTSLVTWSSGSPRWAVLPTG